MRLCFKEKGDFLFSAKVLQKLPTPRLNHEHEVKFGGGEVKGASGRIFIVTRPSTCLSSCHYLLQLILLHYCFALSLLATPQFHLKFLLAL